VSETWEHTNMPVSTSSPVEVPLARLPFGSTALTFAGQGSSWIDTLSSMSQDDTRVAALLERVENTLARVAASDLASGVGAYGDGVAVGAWVKDPDSRPSAAALAAGPISQPMILVTQLLRYRDMLESGLSRAISRGAVAATTGHSQGLVAAAIAAGAGADGPTDDHILDGVRLLAYQALTMEWAWKRARPARVPADATPMAAVGGLRREEIYKALTAVGADQVDIGLSNTPTRCVLSGDPAQLEAVRQFVEAQAEKLHKKRKAGRHGGRVPMARWEYLAVSAPFHSRFMADARAKMREITKENTFELPRGDHFPLLTCASGAPLDMDGRLEKVLDAQFDLAVRWVETVRALPAKFVLDLGPGDGVAVLSMSALKGRGVAVHPLSRKDVRESWLDATQDIPSAPASWARFAPAAARVDDNVVVDNLFTRVTGKSPVILGGMTPTTVEVPIVAAAANAGFPAELAGGGQVTEEIFWSRMDELRDALQPGRKVVFNALYLDPYLWGLHLGRTRLVQQAAERGYPLSGVTISAGIPPVDEAVALLDELVSLGLTENAFKPGTVDQVKRVVQIAEAAPHHTIFMHLEGGRAGGHHSWEDLDDLLLQAYALIRRTDNIVLCVGGGVGTPERAAQLLDGTWASRWGELPMPVDAVFLGTAAMACLEACTSPSVKAALAAAPGVDAWVYDGQIAGEITSGRSALNADIHYLNSSASRCGALLDQLAGDAEAVAARKGEIIEALNATAKPFFGELDSMSWLAVAERMVELMAIGRNGRYEDGVWMDRTWRARVQDVLQRAESRLADGDFTSDFDDAASLDDPKAALATFAARWPAAAAARLQPADKVWFISKVCRRPGKPVPFVPVIDADVRRWYKSDSLWYAHDDRFTADQVLALPGPTALPGIQKADEPVAEMFARFEKAMVADREVTHRSARVELISAPTPALAALTVVPSVRVGDRYIPNPVRRLALGPAVAGRRELRWTLPGSGETILLLDHLDGGLSLVVGGLTVPFSVEDTLDAGFSVDREAWNDAIGAMYRGGMAPVAPFEVAEQVVTVPDTTDYATATLAVPAWGVPHGMAFTLCWTPLLAVLGAEPFAGEMLDLVHLRHHVETTDAWPPVAGEQLVASAELVGISDDHVGRRLDVRATLRRGEEVVAELDQSFLLRRGRSVMEDGHRPVEMTLRALEEAEASWIQAQPWCDGAVSGELVLRGVHHLNGGGDGFTGVLERDGEPVATLRVTEHGTKVLDIFRGFAVAPLDQGVPEAVNAETRIRAPRRMDAFARASRDGNPIHRSEAMARIAGFEQPIVHGMWTAGAAWSAVVEHVADGEADRITAFTAFFEAPVPPGSELDLQVTRVARVKGAIKHRAVVRMGDTTVLRADVHVAPPRTAWVFPGQGIQQQGMGMDGYGRSSAARGVWDRLDAWTRENLGFSILRIVRENPREIVVQGERHVHPQGVLNLTHFTQVAMAVLAQAQVAELREAGVWVDGIVAGHSVGEYNAIGALAGALPPEAVVATVYQRGRVMHTLVPRDAEGNSGYAMGVIRPHHAGLTDKQAVALVERIADKAGEHLEIVNYNVRGRQYSVTGTVKAINLLADALKDSPGPRPAWVMVPGIDVPFHSRVLRDGVPDFRATMEKVFPERIPASTLVGRYIPNLTAKMFELTPEFIKAMSDATGESMDHFIARLGEDDDKLTRDVLIELLAWQFASPVQWIKTQDLFLEQTERLVEIGVGYQPTLSNMMRSTLRSHPTARMNVQNAEADRDNLFGEDEVAAPVAAVVEETAATEEAAPVAAAAPAASADRPSDRPLSVGYALRALIALQASLRAEQIDHGETLDDVFDGVSSRRNQVLLDLGAEFGVSGLDGAHTVPLRELEGQLSSRPYGGPGKYLAAAIDAALQKGVGRAGWRRADVVRRLESHWGFGPGLVDHGLVALALASRDGASARGGDLGVGPAANKDGANQLVDAAVADIGVALGTSFSPMAKAATAAVSSEALDALEEKLLGKAGALAKMAEALNTTLEEPADDRALLAETEAAPSEPGEEYISGIQPRFDANKAVTFGAAWAFARRDVAELVAMGRKDVDAVREPLRRIALFANAPEVQATLRFYADRVDGELAGLLLEAAQGGRLAPNFPEFRPMFDADGYREEPTGKALADRSWPVSMMGATDGTSELIRSLSEAAGETPDLRGRTALVTGASPGSIAMEAVRHLLRAGAHVVVTTSRPTRQRLAAYRAFHRAHAGPGGQLTVVPFNQASDADCRNIIDWLFDARDEAVGAATKRIKGPTPPEWILPFAAMPDLGTLVDQGDRSEVALRAMLTGVERMIAQAARRFKAEGMPARRCHVVLPLSPNHGGMGGDGSYGASKAGLEVLMNRATSEAGAWGDAFTMLGARIGWVRGTGLMAANNTIAARLEEMYGPVTFSSQDMGWLIAAACSDRARAACAGNPMMADLTGGLRDIPNWGQQAGKIREELNAEMAADRVHERLDGMMPSDATATHHALPSVKAHVPMSKTEANWKAADLRKMVVIVGAGEVGPHGSSRTRWAVESHDLSDAAVVELAWMCGLVRFDAEDGWVDADGAAIAEHSIADTYREEVLNRSGIRFVDMESAGFDPAAETVMQAVVLDEDFRFQVGSEDEARGFLAQDPEGTRVEYRDGTWFVVRTQGTTVRVPKQVTWSRRVGGVIPKGFDPARYGIPADMIANVDPVSLVNLVATVDAFLSAGLTPEELMRYVHPARVANTQGSGMGGMEAIRRMYVNPVLGEERQPDQLQEGLINVMAAYAVQSYVGSYGAMVHPVAACATAALSMEEAFDKILIGKADVVVAGGYDELSLAGMVGFADMHATANTDEMLEKGLEPDQMSRPGDIRRRGFVESEGGGTLLLARGDIAAKLGLPVLAVLGWAGSFGDGVHTSIPAPGLGALSSAIGGQKSPLALALAAHGLNADDIGVVSKHDTSTQANDPNEAELHQRLQDALGRTPGNPLWVVSQKHLTGHPKGGAAAWQAVGMTQILRSGIIPGNKNLDCPDGKLRPFSHLAYTERSLAIGDLRAGLITSLGFGHVSALLLMIHPDAFFASLGEQADAYHAKAGERLAEADARLARMIAETERPYVKRADRPDAGNEAEMLLDPNARFIDGRFQEYRA